MVLLVEQCLADERDGAYREYLRGTSRYLGAISQ